MYSDFNDALVTAIPLLQALPRKREEVSVARTHLEDFQKAHSDIRVNWVIDQPPGSPWVEYDLLLEHPNNGTLALLWRADEGIPWSVHNADHWAANYVMTINNREITVQQALLFLKFTGKRDKDLLTEMIEQQLIAMAIEEDPPPVSEEELQRAADEFRRASGLLSAEATYRWLEELGLSLDQFQHHLRGSIQMYKLKESVTEDEVESYYEMHRESFGLVQYFRVETVSEIIASSLAEVARDRGLLAATQAHMACYDDQPLTGSLLSQYAHKLPLTFVNASAGAVIGPVSEGGRQWVAEVLSRQPACLDARTRMAVGNILFREWLAERRAQAIVHWHWMS